MEIGLFEAELRVGIFLQQIIYFIFVKSSPPPPPTCYSRAFLQLGYSHRQRFLLWTYFKFCRPDTWYSGQLVTYMPGAGAAVQRVLSVGALIAHNINLTANVESGRDSSD